MKKLQIKFSSQYFAMILLFSRVKSRKTCKPGDEDVTSQPFHFTSGGESEVRGIRIIFVDIPDKRY